MTAVYFVTSRLFRSKNLKCSIKEHPNVGFGMHALVTKLTTLCCLHINGRRIEIKYFKYQVRYNKF